MNTQQQEILCYDISNIRQISNNYLTNCIWFTRNNSMRTGSYSMQTEDMQTLNFTVRNSHHAVSRRKIKKQKVKLLITGS